MWTQRDQIQAYQFLRRRLVSALVTADANDPVSPSRRLILATAIGLGLGVLVAAVFGIIGLLNPSGGKDWKQGGSVIVEKETGARFVLGEDGMLHPVLNYASARLLAGGSGDKTVTVPAEGLRSVPRGATIGIPGAPDSLPPTDSLVEATLLSCSRRSPDQPAAAEPVASVAVGVNAPGGRLEPGKAAVLSLRTGERFLLTAGHRFRLPDPASIAALGLDGAPTIPVSRAWLNTVPVGRDLGLVAVPGAGARGPKVGPTDTKVGMVLTVDNPGGALGFYLVRNDGLASITQTEANLVVGNPANRAALVGGGPSVARVSAADVATAPRSPVAGSDTGTDQAARGGYPQRIPTLASFAGDSITLCAVGDGRTGSEIVVGDEVPLPADARVTPVPFRSDDRVANEVYVPPGRGALVAEEPASGVSSGTIYLVTDSGSKFPIATADAISALGYGGIQPQGVSASLLALLPTGPTLDPVRAQLVVAGPVAGGAAGGGVGG